jgi:very-short-patch-repair endonuclease
VLDGQDRFVARVDFAYPDRRLAIEVDGYELRASPAAMQSDLDRQNALVREGWTVLRFTWADVVRRPARVAELVRSTLAGTSAETLAG